MSTGLYGITTRAPGTVLTSTIYNADHQNHVTNQIPQMTGAYSDDVTQMRLQTSPGGVGTESLAPSLAGEMERLRFVLARAVGKAIWYDAPPVTLTPSTKAQMEAATDTATIPTPAQLKNHPGIPKVSVYLDSAGTLIGGFGATTLRLGLGRYQILFTTAFANTGYRIHPTPDGGASITAVVESRATGNCIIDTFNSVTGAAIDDNISVTIFGTLP